MLVQPVTIEQVQKATPEIHVFSTSHGAETLTMQSQDHRFWNQPLSDTHKLLGEGTYSEPYKYEGPAPVSPHYGIIDLWIKFHHLAYPGCKIYIRVFIWLLELLPDGVKAEDGTITTFELGE